MIVKSVCAVSSGTAARAASAVPRGQSCTAISASIPKCRIDFSNASWSVAATMIRRVGDNADKVLQTCQIKGAPANSCKAFGRCDFIRVPRPAARITTAVRIDAPIQPVRLRATASCRAVPEPVPQHDQHPDKAPICANRPQPSRGIPMASSVHKSSPILAIP